MPCNEPNPACVTDQQKLLRAGRLHNQAGAALRRRLAEEPGDAGALLRLGDLHRRRESFPAAAEAYGRLCALRPGERRQGKRCFTVNGWFRSRDEEQDAGQSSRAAAPPPTP